VLEATQAEICELGLERPIVMGHSFGSFVAQHHMAEYGTAAGYVLMGTVDSVEELGITEGSDVLVIIKASDVMLAVND